MNRLSIIPFMLLGLLGFDAKPQTTGSLTIHFEGMNSDAGHIIAALVGSKSDFLAKNRQPLKNYHGKIKQRQSRWQIDSLAFGHYAISVYHDINDNHELDSGLFGIPIEIYGFSNNARASFGPPDYDKARFEFSKSGQTLYIWLR